MGQQSRAKRDRRLGRRKAKKVVPLTPGELAAAEHDRKRAAIHRHLEAAGVMARVRAVIALMSTPAYVDAQHKAISQAELSALPPRNEEDVRSIILDVLRDDPFNADLRDVLLKVRVNQRTKRMSVSAGPGIEAARAAMAAAALELEPPKLSVPAVAAG